jgi:hypothetical protein
LRIFFLAAFAPGFVAGAILVAGGCSSTTITNPATTDDAAVDAADESFLEPAEAAPPPACKLVESTTSKVCNDCLQKNCCVVINTCLNDKQCDALNACIADCGMRLGMNDAGVACVKDCIAQRPDAAPAVNDLFECESTRCDLECK